MSAATAGRSTGVSALGGRQAVIDSGYDPDDDRRIVDAAVAASHSGRSDLMFVYLVAPDLAGHAHGFDSAEYLAAATGSDTHLARLLDAVGDRASVLVTTDHGGLGADHADQVPDGELVAFDNRRVLHGRRAFKSTERRHLQGCYIDIDAIHSTARLNDAAHRPAPGSGCL